MAKIHVTDPGFSADISYSNIIQGGTTGSQPVFDGAPLFESSYSISGHVVHFRIKVLMTNISNFGTGQYYMTLPFNSRYEYYLRNGHITDFSTGKKYAISAHVAAGTNVMYLYTTGPNGNEDAFTSSVPFNLNQQDDFHFSGEYVRQ